MKNIYTILTFILFGIFCDYPSVLAQEVKQKSFTVNTGIVTGINLLEKGHSYIRTTEKYYLTVHCKDTNEVWFNKTEKKKSFVIDHFIYFRGTKVSLWKIDNSWVMLDSPESVEMFPDADGQKKINSEKKLNAFLAEFGFLKDYIIVSH